MDLSKEQLDILEKAFSLSPREKRIVALLFLGVEGNSELAERMGLKLPTAKLAMRVLYAKTHSQSKLGVVVAALDAIRRSNDG